MPNLSPQKQTQLVGIAAGILIFVAGYWYAFIQPQGKLIEDQEKKVAEVRSKIETAKRNSQMLHRFEDEYNRSKAALRAIEILMPSGDVYRWMVQAFESMQKTNWVMILNIDPPKLGEVEIPPVIPYSTALFNVTGVGYFHDIGLFLANMENSMPFVRLQSLELKRASLADTGGVDREQLSFSMELLSLIKTDPVE